MDDRNEIREPVVSGSFYPGDSQTLKRTIQGFLSTCTAEPVPDRIIGLVSPHAGYVYSGQVAAEAYKQIINQEFEIVVVLSPSHSEPFPGISIFSGKGYRTPLGDIPVAKSLAEKIAKHHELLLLSAQGHTQEHALEVQLPFLQMVLDNFHLIPIIMGEQSWYVSEILAEALAEILRNESALIVASSDLSHYYADKQARILDQRIIHRIEKFDSQGLIEDLKSQQSEACGGGCIAATMHAAKLLGAVKSDILRYITSGDINEDRREVVGYLSAAFSA